MIQQLLNRLRKRTKTSPLSQEDLETLAKCDTGEENNASLHILATNHEVHEYNLKQLIDFCPEAETIEAEVVVRQLEK